jgi:energy-coupling factor transporter ATP-binding protein EcfA2
MLAPADVEIRVLSAITSMHDLGQFQEFGLDESSFLLFGDVYAYIVEYAHTYQDVPRKEDIEVRFKDTDSALELEAPGNLDYYLTALHTLAMARNVRDVIRRRIGEHGSNIDQNPDEAARLIAHDLGAINHRRSRNVAMLDRDALFRLAALKEKIEAAEAGKIIGIPTGLKCFDEYQEGWKPGEGIMLIGPKGSGKSWMLMHFAVTAYHAGFKVLFFSPEMSWEECALRFDVMLARKYHAQMVTHTQLKTGVQVDLDDYRRWLETLTDRSDFMCVDSVSAQGFTLTGMLAMISEFQPDLVCLDGIHLVKDEKGDQQWQVIKDCADGFKNDAQRNKRVAIWVGQVDREGMKNPTEPVNTGAQAAYSKAAVEAANRLITIGADSDDPYRRVFKVPNNRSGREWHEKQTLIFEVDTGHIEQASVQQPSAFNMADFEEEI